MHADIYHEFLLKPNVSSTYIDKAEPPTHVHTERLDKRTQGTFPMLHPKSIKTMGNISLSFIHRKNTTIYFHAARVHFKKQHNTYLDMAPKATRVKNSTSSVIYTLIPPSPTPEPIL